MTFHTAGDKKWKATASHKQVAYNSSQPNWLTSGTHKEEKYFGRLTPTHDAAS
jgi:hypothetical protein